MPNAVLDASPVTGRAASAGQAVAAIAARLAQLLGSLTAGRDGPLDDGIAFLQRMSADVGGVRRVSGGPDALPQALRQLRDQLSLAPVEIDLFLLAAMPDEHEGYASVLRAVHPRGVPRPTVGLAAQLFCEAASERVALREVLELGEGVRSGALVVERDGPFFERSLTLADSLWPVVHGLNVWPDVIRAHAEATPTPSTTSLDEWLATRAARRACAAIRAAEPRLVLVVAESEEAACRRAAALAAAAGASAVTIEANVFDPASRGDALRLGIVHAVARGAIPILRVPSSGLGASIDDAPDFPNIDGPMIVCATSPAVVARATRPVITVVAERLTSSARVRLWRTLLPELADDAPVLASRYALEPHTVDRVCADARSASRLTGAAISLDDIATSVRTRAALSLSAGVKQVHAAASWNHLVLAADRTARLQEAVDRLRHQPRVLDEWGFLAQRAGARGVRMLFAGPPGTGKTLAAEVLATALGVDLLIVDISRVVSKWIGETEKNLSEVFDTAERAQAVLLFDEADALFGRRTDVSDAHDRYANLETAYLLSRLERFEGLAILSTNLRQNIDPAFARRLEFILDFDEPTASEREALWRCHIPERAPIAPDVRFGDLAAEYPIVGGLIRNAAVAAAFLATADRSPITRHHFVHAIRREYDKVGRAFPTAPDAA